MSQRNHLNSKPAITVAAALLVLAACGLIGYKQLVPPPLPSLPPIAWYYDLATQKIFIASAKVTPPISMPTWLPGGIKSVESGGVGGIQSGVRAHIYSCGHCADVSTRFISYLESTAAPADPHALAAATAPVGPATRGDAVQEDLQNPVPTEPLLVQIRVHILALMPDEEGSAEFKWVADTSLDGKEILVSAASYCGDKSHLQPPAVECTPDKNDIQAAAMADVLAPHKSGDQPAKP